MRFREFLQEEAMQAYVCVQSGHGIQIDGETRWFEIGDVVYARKHGNFYDLLIGDKIKSWWYKFFEEVFFRGTLEEYQRKFLDDLKEDVCPGTKFVVIKPFAVNDKFVHLFSPGEILTLDSIHNDKYRIKLHDPYDTCDIHKSVADKYLSTDLKAYHKKFFNDLREEEMSGLDFVKAYSQNIAKHIPGVIKEVPVTFKKTAYAEKKRCFNNAIQYLIIENDKAKYVLGFVMVHGVPIEHAWIKENGEYFDVTIQNTGPYFSLIELDYSQVMKFFRKNHFGPDLVDLIRSGIAK